MNKSHTPSKKTSTKHNEGVNYVISGKISGGATAQGPHAKVVVYQTDDQFNNKELIALFEKLSKLIERRPEDPNIGKEEISEVVKNLEAEFTKSKNVNQVKLERWMKNLAQMAPDILDVILASLGGPISGTTVVLKKIAEHAKTQVTQ
jgi:hypothetical protein